LSFGLCDQAKAMCFLCHLSAVHSVAHRGLHDRRVWLPLVDVRIEDFHTGHELPPGAIARELIAPVVLTAETCLLKLRRQHEPGAGILPVVDGVIVGTQGLLWR